MSVVSTENEPFVLKSVSFKLFSLIIINGKVKWFSLSLIVEKTDVPSKYASSRFTATQSEAWYILIVKLYTSPLQGSSYNATISNKNNIV